MLHKILVLIGGPDMRPPGDWTRVGEAACRRAKRGGHQGFHPVAAKASDAKMSSTVT